MSAQRCDGECLERSAPAAPDPRGRTPVLVCAADALSAEGAKAFLGREPTVELVKASEWHRARVALVVADDLGDTVVRQVRAIQHDGLPRIIVVASQVHPDRVASSSAVGIPGVLHRAEATRASLAEAIRQVDQDRSHRPASCPDSGSGSRPAAKRASQASPAPPTGAPTASPRLSEREREILRLLADGHRTDEVAQRIAYSESTIKVTLARIMGLLGARNRCEAVARALRLGIIR